MNRSPARPAPPDWLAGCRAGEPAAVERMFAECLPMVERVLWRLVGPSCDLEDLVQNTFVAATRSIGRYRGDASFKTWITSIAIHTAHHHLRAGRLRRYVPLEAVPEADLPRTRPDVENAFDERRLAMRLHALLDHLTPPKRIALLLFAVEARPVEEVAALMGASQTATRSRVFFARRELRALIAADPALSEMAHALLGEGTAGGRP